jgi:3-oxo-5-alpha-steroid 4-dehydrogenase 1
MQIQECPSLLVTAFLAVAGGVDSYLQHPTSPRTLLTIAFLTHYSYRCIVYPLLIRGGKPTPVVIMLMAFAFCCLNGYLQVTTC